MKLKLIALLTGLAMSTSAFAHGTYYGYRPHYAHSGGSDWVAPLIVGGAVGYILAQPRQQTVIVQQPAPVIVDQPYSPNQPIYQYQDIYFNDCNCMKRVLVQVN